MRLFDGAEPFHGTNPISVAVPSGQDDPWLLDMATSSVPFNRVELHRSLQRDLAKGVASDSDGRDTTDPFSAEMLHLWAALISDLRALLWAASPKYFLPF